MSARSTIVRGSRLWLQFMSDPATWQLARDRALQCEVIAIHAAAHGRGRGRSSMSKQTRAARVRWVRPESPATVTDPQTFDHGAAVEVRTSPTDTAWVAATYDRPAEKMRGWHWVRVDDRTSTAVLSASICVHDGRIRPRQQPGGAP